MHEGCNFAWEGLTMINRYQTHEFASHRIFLGSKILGCSNMFKYFSANVFVRTVKLSVTRLGAI